MKLIWQTVDNQARTWKMLFKALTLIQFLIKNGNERVVEECRDHLHSIRPLQDYNFYEGTVDKGSGVRDLSKAVVELLSSNEMIRSEREKARQLRHKFTGVGNDGNRGGGGGFGGDPYGGRNESYAQRGIGSDNFNSGRRDSYKDSERESGGGDRDSGGSSNRRGGGAYDSDRPNRFDDNSRNDSSDDLDYASKMKARRESKSGGSKLKVNIKGNPSSS